MICKGMEQRYRTLRQCMRGVGCVALVFSLTVAVLLSMDWMRSGVSQTVRSDVLEQALAQGRATPGNEQVVAFARQLDRLARRAYFNSVSFRQCGMALLVLGLLVTGGCFGVAWRITVQIPDPREGEEPDPARTDRLTVTVVLSAGLVLLLLAAGVEIQNRKSGLGQTDAALRRRLENPALKPGEQHVCPCRKGTPSTVLEAQWPFFRGPTLSGRAVDSVPPVVWNGVTGERIAWKTALDFGGSSSPVVWGDRLFVTTGNATARRVLAYSAKTGEKMWDTVIPDGARGTGLPDAGEDTGLAASTPACDELHVYAVFGSGDLAAVKHDGTIAWQSFLGRPKNTYGHASSLIYSGEMLVVQWDQEEQARILALDKLTGKTLWETSRAVGMAWSTPLVLDMCDRKLLLVHACNQTWGMELSSGKKLWQVDAVGGEVAPSLTWEKDIFLAANCYSRMIAFKMSPGGGAVPQKLWQWEEGNLPDVSSPVIRDGLVFYATDGGEVGCHDLMTGAVVWQKEFKGGFYASAIIAGGGLYVVDREKGDFRVLSADREGQERSVNPMGEPVTATAAFVGGRIYIRSKRHLWCVEGK